MATMPCNVTQKPGNYTPLAQNPKLIIHSFGAQTMRQKGPSKGLIQYSYEYRTIESLRAFVEWIFAGCNTIQYFHHSSYFKRATHLVTKVFYVYLTVTLLLLRKVSTYAFITGTLRKIFIWC